MSSRLFQEVREKQGLAYSVYSFVSSFYDTGLLGIYLGVRRDMVKKALPIVLREIETLRTQAIPREELRSAQEQLKGNMLLSAESTDSRMSRLAKCTIYYNKFIPLEEVVADIDSIASDEVQNLAAALFNNDFFTYTFLGPVQEKQIPSRMLVMH
jgi:predicted Zn-dependent peptidase